jgi:hypothetical protein
MLKSVGLLSKGEFIEVKPSDLKGSAQGQAAERTAEILERAKGT